ncbi:transglutaminase domain-containing protein [Snuella lapsa]|uniref:Transglutaminase-like domain-containing protein n=1 Tax=Snuella lapsa TaxID=870481 RepID=A0ABP6XDB9_9FLAO
MRITNPLTTTGIIILVFSGLYYVNLVYAFVDLKEDNYTKSLIFTKKTLPNHKTDYKKLVNNKGEFVQFFPYDYDNLYQAKAILDSLKKIYALVKIEEEDHWKISEEQLKNHVQVSVDTWKTSKFSKHISFESFCNYILPYRIENEKLSDYRTQVLNTFSQVLDSIQSLETPKQAVSAINNEFKKKLAFDLRSHVDLNNPSVLEVLSQQKGSCKSITQFTALAMRSMGLAVRLSQNL